MTIFTVFLINKCSLAEQKRLVLDYSTVLSSRVLFLKESGVGSVMVYCFRDAEEHQFPSQLLSAVTKREQQGSLNHKQRAPICRQDYLETEKAQFFILAELKTRTGLREMFLEGSDVTARCIVGRQAGCENEGYLCEIVISSIPTYCV